MTARPLRDHLLRGFFRVDDSLLVARYRAALETIGAPAPERECFHIDAAGYSPEIAADRRDPFYLGAGPLSALAVVVAAEQLAAPLVHPSLGYAADAYRRVTAGSAREISTITLREPLIAEIQHPSTHLVAPEQLADLAGFEIRFRTPGGLVRGVAQLEALEQEFLASNRRWLDDDFIGDMASLAGEVRDLGRLSDEFVASRHTLGPFYSPAFGGSYVLEEAGALARSATTHVLCAKPPSETAEGDARPSTRGRRVIVEALRPDAAAQLLERFAIAHLDVRTLRRRPEILEKAKHWLAVRHLLAHEPDRSLAGRAPHEVIAAMRGRGDPPPEYLELEEVSRRLCSERGGLDPGTLSPATRLRLLTPSSTRAPICRFVRHLLAFLDEPHLERTWHDAPDVFFARLPHLDEARRVHFASWLASQSDA